jgi:hypothetical protein
LQFKNFSEPGETTSSPDTASSPSVHPVSGNDADNEYKDD